MLFVCGLGLLAIAATSRGYFFGEDDPPFISEKLPLPWESVWLFALKTHVASALAGLFGCLLLMSNSLRIRAPWLHTVVGRVNALVVLFAVVPTGFYLSFFATGGLWSTLGFLLSGTVTAVGMLAAVRAARRKDFVAHRRFATHVFAQLSVAISSRLMLVVLGIFTGDSYATYLISLWVPVVGSALAAEYFSRSPHPRSHREVSLHSCRVLLGHPRQS